MLASLYLLGVLVPHTVGAQPPAIYLFPTNVVENIKQTGRVARDMESALQTSVADLEQQWLLYEENRCEDAAGDPGCDQIKMLLGDTYLRMLLLMDASLPRMQASISNSILSWYNHHYYPHAYTTVYRPGAHYGPGISHSAGISPGYEPIHAPGILGGSHRIGHSALNLGHNVGHRVSHSRVISGGHGNRH